jgi:hypothetical protein
MTFKKAGEHSQFLGRGVSICREHSQEKLNHCQEKLNYASLVRGLVTCMRVTRGALLSGLDPWRPRVKTASSRPRQAAGAPRHVANLAHGGANPASGRLATTTKPTLIGSQRFTIKFRCGIQRWPAQCADLQNLMKNGSGDEATAEGSGGS